MKKMFFAFRGVIEISNDMTEEQVRNALKHYVGMEDLSKNNPLDLGEQIAPKRITYKSVSVREEVTGEETRYETDNATARELASKLNSAATECGDFPVINSLVMPVPGGDGFSYVVYHKGDDQFELE